MVVPGVLAFSRRGAPVSGTENPGAWSTACPDTRVGKLSLSPHATQQIVVTYDTWAYCQTSHR
jgi:hypothetical protein